MTSERKTIVVSGTRPTGKLHLGNYFGAVRQFVKLQDNGEQCYFFIADWHSLTTHPKSQDLKESIKTVVVEYLGSGLDPEKIVLYKQSDLREISELYLYINMFAYKGELERVTTFKDKARSQPDNINAGLLTYPSLMAADIMIHRATHVPVGKDQEQHLEMTREFARRINNTYGAEYFPEPEAYNFGDKLIKVPGLDGMGKMSKSGDEMSCIYLEDDAQAIEKKIKKAKSDSGIPEEEGKMSDAAGNLLQLLRLVGGEEQAKHFEEQYFGPGLRYGDLKKELKDSMVAYLEPIRTRIESWKNEDTKLQQIMKDGAERATESGRATLQGIRERIGID